LGGVILLGEQSIQARANAVEEHKTAKVKISNLVDQSRGLRNVVWYCEGNFSLLGTVFMMFQSPQS
jgi:hypothetical protein